MPKEKIDIFPEEWGLTDKEIKELSKGLTKADLEVIFKNGDLKIVIGKLVKNTSLFFAKREDIEFTFQLFKWYYDQVGMKFEKKDAEEVRANMLHLSRTLNEIHLSQSESEIGVK